MILPLEQQVCSLESARKLKELGLPQESLFYWVNWGKVGIWQCRYKEHIDKYFDEVIARGYETISAYTCSELGNLLPDSIRASKNIGHTLSFDKWRDQWLCCYGPMDDKPYYPSLVEAMTKQLICLTEAGMGKG